MCWGSALYAGTVVRVAEEAGVEASDVPEVANGLKYGGRRVVESRGVVLVLEGNPGETSPLDKLNEFVGLPVGEPVCVCVCVCRGGKWIGLERVRQRVWSETGIPMLGSHSKGKSQEVVG